MERIRQALEKARRERIDAEVIGSPGRHARVVTPGADADLSAIRYSRTRVAALDAGHLDDRRIVAHDKSDPMSRPFDLLRTQVLQKMDGKGWRTLAVTSPAPGAGKTVVAINLAISIAQQTQTSAMLVDFDLRDPRVGAYLGLANDVSLNEVLEGAAELPDALIHPGIPRLVVLPAARTVAHPSEVLASKRVAALVAELRARYASRIVIFDLGPLLGTDDALAVLPQMDCALLVVGEGMSSQGEIEQSLRYVGAGNLVGVVLNGVAAAARPYAYR
jgi:hypothetical protein